MTDAQFIHKEHNVSVLMYHFVCYRKVVFDNEMVNKILKDTCIEISKRFEIHFLEIGTDLFLIQSIPIKSSTQIITVIKNITFKLCPEVKKQLWGGEFWSKGFYVDTGMLTK